MIHSSFLRFLTHTPGLIAFFLFCTPLSVNADGDAPLHCSDHLESVDSLQKRLSLSQDLASSQEFLSSVEKTRLALLELEENKAFASLTADEIVSHFMPVLKSRPLQDAMAKTFRQFSVTNKLELKNALQALVDGPLETRIDFVHMTIQKMDEMVEDGLRILDQASPKLKKVDLLYSRWGVNKEKFLELVQQWEIMREAGHFETKIMMIHYLNLVDSREVQSALRRIKDDLIDLKPMTNADRLMAARLHNPFTDSDLAYNRGPISEKAFERKLLLFRVTGIGTRALDQIRRPNLTVAMVGLSFFPVMAVKFATHSWDGFTNVIATLMGGVGTSPLLIKIFEKAAKPAKEYWWIHALNLSQLTRMEQFIMKYPKNAHALQLDESLDVIQSNIRRLRRIRYPELYKPDRSIRSVR